MSREAANAFTVTAARYAKGMMALVTHDGVDMFKGRAARLADYLNARYSNRERAYILSPAKVEKLRNLYAAGYDSGFTKELYKV